jgi:aldehyde:ferredoxin oxidoreductase
MYGYAGTIALINLSTQGIDYLSTGDYTERFIGGKGIAAKLFWDLVKPDINALDPENCLIFMTGPFAGILGVAGSRWVVCGKSPATHPPHFLGSNFGGRWGAALKSCGFDGLILTGRSENPVFLLIDGETISFEDAGRLWGKDTIQTGQILKEGFQEAVAVAAIGPAGENRVPTATILADDDSSGSGLGAVMGSKLLKAIAVLRTKKIIPPVYDVERLKELTHHLKQLKPDGSEPYFKWMQQEKTVQERLKRQICYGCISGCNRMSFESTDGEKGKLLCTAGDYYKPLARSYYGESNEVPFKATRLCDRYGIDITFILSLIRWLHQCHLRGLLKEEDIGIPISKIGSSEFIEHLVRQVSFKQGFGKVLAEGIDAAAGAVGGKAQELLTLSAYDKMDRPLTYSPRLYLPNALLYALEFKKQTALLHRIVYTLIPWKFWSDGLSGSPVSSRLVQRIMKSYWDFDGDFASYEGQAKLAKAIQNRVYAQDNLVLCDKAWSIVFTGIPEEPMVSPDLEAELFSTITGRNMATAEFLKTGERMFNLQRAIYLREGHQGIKEDTLPDSIFNLPLETEHNNAECVIPGKEGHPVSRKGATLNRAEFEKMRRDYYRISGWDIATGYPTANILNDLNLNDVSADLKRRKIIENQ